MKPEFIDYPNAQFLMIGSAENELGRAASAELDGKNPQEEQPGEELEHMELENEHRVDALKGMWIMFILSRSLLTRLGDHTVYEDLGLEAKKYPKVPTTWTDQS